MSGGTPTPLLLKRCSCPSCSVAAAAGCGFWATVRSLRVDVAGHGQLLRLDGGLLLLMRRCTRLRLAAGCSPLGPAQLEAAWPEAASSEPDLGPWLAAFVPVFAASTALESLELQAAAASLHPTQEAAGASWELWAGDGAVAWGLPSLEAGGLAAGGTWEERAAGLAAELRRPPGAVAFQLRVRRCEE